MKRILPALAFTLVAMSLAQPSFSQSPTISVGGNKQSKDVYLKDLNVQVDVVGNIATTTLTMVFQNRTSKVLEAELLFPLPDGVTVSRYALDINGRMREAVPVDKAKGTQVFEEIERRRVDPGLMERVEGNNFRTRIYPIPANGSRTITVGYEQQLQVSGGKLAYRLPMDYKEAIDKFTLTVSVYQATATPQVEGGMASDIRFDKAGNAYIAKFSRTNYKPGNLLSFSLPYKPDEVKTLMQPASGSYYFTASCTPEGKPQPKVWSDVVGIVWDASYSVQHRNIEAELEVIDAIVKQKKNLTVNLALLNHTFTNAGSFNIVNGDWSKLRETLKGVTYDGGTNYMAIELFRIPSQEYILFSDGMSTLSDADFVVPLSLSQPIQKLRTSNFGRMIHTVVSSPKADYSTLKLIAAQTGGKFINLNSLTPQEAQKELMNETLRFIGIKPNDAVREVYPSTPTPVGSSFAIAGIASQPNVELVLQFGYGSTVAFERTVSLNASAQATSDVNVHRLWAQKKIAELDMNYEKNKGELAELGQEFGIVTHNTSLIVLETLQDYITYEITPPAELLAEYNQWKKNRDEQLLSRKEDLLSQSIESANALKAWWNTRFDVKTKKYPKPDGQYAAESISAADAIQFTAPMIVEEENLDSSLEENKSRVDEVALGYSANKKESSTSGYKAQVQARITLTDIKQDKEYLKGLTGKPADDYKMYLTLRATYGATPDFFFDMANWFMQKGDREKALSVLTCIADMEVENASLFRLLGYRLKEYGEYSLQEYVCKKVVDWRPMEPQSYRDYALALADNGKYQQALDGLYATITQQYATSLNVIYSGIEEVLVTEINQLTALHKGLHKSAIDKQLLVGPLPVDIRVVINWNMNNTDIDLHVKDPRGETCCYSNRQTAIGGIISNDITRGYGPEQFMLKKAIKGKYQVYVNYFGDTQVKADGPSTIMAEIYTSYSDKSQKREVVCLQLSNVAKTDRNEGLVQVAEFEF